MALVEKLIETRTKAVKTIQFKRLMQGRKYINRAQSAMIYDFVVVSEERFNKRRSIAFPAPGASFRQ